MPKTKVLERQAGGLYVQSPDPQLLSFPLKHTDVQANVTGNIARVEVTQRFENPFTTALEAVYVFPLPDEAAVDDMLLRVGDRTIQGSIKKRQEAQQIYEKAKQQGRTAGLLEQERDNVFTQSLANIQPGEQIEVIIRYTESLKFEAGNYEFVFPMVIGPRYIPGTPIENPAIGGGSAAAPMLLNQDTDLVPDASRLNAPILPAGMRSGQDIQVTVEIDAGVEIRELCSPSHQIQSEQLGSTLRVTLAGADTIPNKDLILRYQVAGDRTQATVLTQADDRGGHFAVYLIPAIQYGVDQVVPKDVVFLIDTSGSQSGAPLFQCQELMRRFIHGLNPNDTFTIIDFADTTQQLSPVPLLNTIQNRKRALQYIDRLTAGGGTELLRGIRAVLNFPVVDPGRLRSIVLLTDGYIGNENQILAEVQRHLKPGNRLYSFGAGSSVNRFLLNRIAELGRGVARVIRHDEPTAAVTEQFFRQINNPVLTNIQLRWEGSGASPIVYPAVPPDLFAEQPLVLFGHKADRLAGKLHLTGIAAGSDRYQQSFDLNFEAIGNPAVAQLWGRARIKDLMNQMVSGDTKAGVEAVTNTALAYQLLSQYTAFVAVSDEVRVDPTAGSVSVQVPVEMPEGISHTGIFGNFVDRPVPAPMAAPMSRVMRQQAAPATPAAPDPFDVSLISPGMIGEPITPLSSDPVEFDDSEDFLSAPAVEDERSLPEPQTIDDRPKQFSLTHWISPLTLSLSSHSKNQLQIISATGLNQKTIALLLRHLQAIQLPENMKGDLVFEFQVNKGRAQQVVWDQQASSLQESSVVEAIRRSLLTWKPPRMVTGTICLHVRL